MIEKFARRLPRLRLFQRSEEHISNLVQISTICHDGPGGQTHWQKDLPAFQARNASGKALILETLEVNRPLLEAEAQLHSLECSGALQVIIIAPNYNHKVSIEY
ncbi:hypothetical protein HY029_01360 [Candidatus Gottesmanbacteria bacterium]|nr:hypothetical protein [Candidatus Gottesmanbacteria bacterium]